MTPTEARTVLYRRIAERRRQQIVQPGRAQTQRWLAGLEQCLLGERADQLMGGDLLLAFDQSEQLPGQIDVLDAGQTGVPVGHKSSTGKFEVAEYGGLNPTLQG